MKQPVVLQKGLSTMLFLEGCNFSFFLVSFRETGEIMVRKVTMQNYFLMKNIGTLEIMASFYHGILTMVNIFNSQSQFCGGNFNSDFFLSF